jgi:hypothetical protein
MKPLLRAALSLVLLPASLAYCQPPSVGFLLPGGIQPGKPVDVVLHGANLASPTGMWSDLPLSAELTPGIEGNGTQPASVSYRFTVPADTPPGVAGIRVATGQGISNLRLILVDDLPSVLENSNNKSPQTAQPVTLPVAVDGACDAETSDFYKISVVAGQRVAVEVFARRLGFPLDPTIRLLSMDGRELAYSDDEPSAGADGRFSHTFDVAGDYLVEIRDIRYQGGGNFRYRLRMGDFPIVSVPYPLAVQKGQSANLQVTGPVGTAPAPVTVNVPAQVPGDRMRVAAGAVGQGAAWVNLIASDTVEQLEVEPNDAPESSTAVQIPGAVDGRFEMPRDVDYYQFQAKQGQRIVFSGQARSLGSPCDLYMRLYNAEGGVLAEAEDAGTAEGALNYTFPADALYRLRVEETNHRGGVDVAYRIVATPYQAGFDLAAEAEKVDAPQNGVFVVKVTAARRDYNGPITLAVEGAGEGHVLRHNIIPEGKPETTLHVTLGAPLTAGHFGTLKIVGTAKVGEADFSATASTLGALRGAFAGLPNPPNVFDGTLGLGVGPVFPQFFTLASASPVASLLKAGATSTVNVSVARTNGFEDAVSVAVAGLPEGVTAKPAQIEKGQNEVAVELTSAKAIPPGKHPIKLVGNASFQNQPQEFAFDQAAITGPPVALAFAPAGALPVGGKQKGTLTFQGDVTPIAAAAGYQGGVTRGAEGPRTPALTGFEADNKAASFSGIDKAPGDDRLTALLPTPAVGDYSVEMWVYNTRDLSQPNAPAISGYFYSRPGTPSAANAQPGDHLGIGGVESSPRDRLFFYDGQSLVAGRTTLSINAWHQVVLVRTGDQVKVYLDGDVANPEIQAAAPKSYATSEIVLGTRADGYAPFQGRLDEVAFFDGALSPEQIQAHFAAAKAMTPARDVILKDSPLAYWRLDETDGAVAASIAPAHKRVVKLAWQNLPAGVSAPAEIVLVDAQPAIEIELAAAESVAPAKVENVIVAGTTAAGSSPFTAESVPVAVEINKP